MPRVNNVYELPAGTYGVSGTPVLSNRYNTFVDDIAADLNAARPITAGGTGGNSAISGFDGLVTKSADIASAATLNLNNATGYFVDVTGNTGITAVTLGVGKQRMVRFVGTPLITVGANLVGNNGGSNIQVEAGDMAIFEGYGSNVVRFWLTRASGGPVSQIGATFTLVSTDDGAGIGPTLALFRNSASPATSDVIGSIDFRGKDSAGNIETYARITSVIVDPTSTSEDAYLLFQANLAGTLTQAVRVTGNAMTPNVNDGAALGSTSQMWSDLYLASGGAINWNNGDVTATHDANALAFAGASSGYFFDADVYITSSDATAAVGPVLSLYRNSASPAAADLTGSIKFIGRNSTPADFVYSNIYGSIGSATAGSETGNINFLIRESGASFTHSIAGNNYVLPSNGSILFGTSLTSSIAQIGSGATQSIVYSTGSGGHIFGQNVISGTFSGSGASAGVRLVGHTGTTNIQMSQNTTAIASHIQFYNPNAQVGSINTSASATSYNTSSDERLKDFIGAYDPEEALIIIRADPARKFTWKTDGSLAVGWGAQTSYAVSPDLASPGFGSPGDEDFRPWGVDQGKRTPYLWAVVPWLADRLDALEARVTALEAV